MFALLLLIVPLFVVQNSEAIQTFEKQVTEGYEWHYVGPQPLDPKDKNISLQVQGSDPYIIFKLKKPVE
jgi:hypothetical protein|tara:strand:+ start:479 stop:685 length:207 start_codon:yes stop_codon:yes gene_type:complete